MSRYRIIEKKGSWEGIRLERRWGHLSLEALRKGSYCCEHCNYHYVPRFIVQEISYNVEFDGEEIDESYTYNKLKEFNDLEEARAFKRDLELDEGIVIEC